MDSGKKEKNFVKIYEKKKKSAGGSPDADIRLENKGFWKFRKSRRLHALDFSGRAEHTDLSLVVTSFPIES